MDDQNPRTSGRNKLATQFSGEKTNRLMTWKVLVPRVMRLGHLMIFVKLLQHLDISFLLFPSTLLCTSKHQLWWMLYSPANYKFSIQLRKTNWNFDVIKRGRLVRSTIQISNKRVCAEATSSCLAQPKKYMAALSWSAGFQSRPLTTSSTNDYNWRKY